MLHSRWEGTLHMLTYRITQIDSRIVVGTEDEAVLICASLGVAHQAVADARLLATIPAKQVFARLVVRTADDLLVRA